MHEVSRWDTDQGLEIPGVAPLAGMKRPVGTKTGEALFHQSNRPFGIRTMSIPPSCFFPLVWFVRSYHNSLFMFAEDDLKAWSAEDVPEGSASVRLRDRPRL